ncbi:MAG: dTDP-glucose 4,6-dehydratase [Cytophagales bacterium]|nr:dTDP-glucose 4,6-dehydratase [Cytophagales bacterium]
MKRHILITGGAGFIGSHVIRRFVSRYPEYVISNLDKLTYAGNLENLRSIENAPNYKFLRGDIADTVFINDLVTRESFDGIIHLAAESHVDRSLENPADFALTNVVGTLNLLHAFRKRWKNDYSGKVFYHISTDEVYGSLGSTGQFTEETPLDPRSPYSASKAASDHFVSAFYHSYGFPAIITRCSNNYGPNHFPEKLIPLIIHNIINQKPLPVYGKGENVRDWLYVEDHAAAIDAVFHGGKSGEVYNIGGNNEWKNIDLVKLLCGVMDARMKRPSGTSEKLITFVKDRPGHDLRYAIDSTKIQRELGWSPSVDFPTGIAKTVDWYLENKGWLEHVTSGAYLQYYDQMYGNR